VGIAVMTPKHLLHRLDSGALGKGASCRDRSPLGFTLKEVDEKQNILDIWVLRELLSRLPRMAAERPSRLTKEAGDAPTLVWSKAIKS
jgi:hypothetical protein